MGAGPSKVQEVLDWKAVEASGNPDAQQQLPPRIPSFEWDKFIVEGGLFKGKPEENQPLKGKLLVITGVSTGEGLGYGVVRLMSALGCSVIILCRNALKAEMRVLPQLVQDRCFKDSQEARERVVCLDCDLNKFDSIRKCVEWSMMVDLPKAHSAPEFNFRQGAKIDFIVNNAGQLCAPHAVTEDGNEWTLQTNYLGHFYLMKELHPYLNPNGARTVQVGGGFNSLGPCLDLAGKLSRKFDNSYVPMNEHKRYNQSKTCLYTLCQELARREPNPKILHLCCNPGNCATYLWNEYMWFSSNYIAVAQQQNALDGCLNIIACLVWGSVGNFVKQQVKTGDYITQPQAAKNWQGNYGYPEVSDLPWKIASDEKAGQALWAVSEQLCKITYDLAPATNGKTNGAVGDMANAANGASNKVSGAGEL